MIQKGRRMWAAGAYGAELGCAPSEDKAAEIVRKMGQMASITSLAIPSTVLRPKSVARYEGVSYRKPGRRRQGDGGRARSGSSRPLLPGLLTFAA